MRNRFASQTLRPQAAQDTLLAPGTKEVNRDHWRDRRSRPQVDTQRAWVSDESVTLARADQVLRQGLAVEGLTARWADRGRIAAEAATPIPRADSEPAR